MLWIAHQRLIFRTSAAPEEIAGKLHDVVEPRKWLRGFGSTSKPYQGEINPRSFKISRIIGYRNSFLPIINGTLERDADQAEIRIVMRLSMPVLAFCAVWFTGVLLGVFISLVAAIAPGKDSPPWPVLLIPTGILVSGYLLIVGAFSFEATKAKKFFEDLFR